MFRRVVCFLLVVCLLSVSVFAEEAAVPFAVVNYTDLFGLRWGYHSDGTVTSIGKFNFDDPADQKVAGAIFALAQQVDARSISQTDINSILNYLNRIEFYLTRLDTSFDGVEGRLENIYAELNTYHRPLLVSISTYLDSLNALLSSFNSAFGSSFRLLLRNSSGSTVHTFSSYSEWLYYFAASLFDFLSSTGGGWFLSFDGSVGEFPAGYSLFDVLRAGLLGLSRNLIGEDQSGVFSFLSPGHDGGLEASEQEVNNLLDALALLGTSLQNPLAKLQYVLASDDDIALKDANKPNEDAFKDNFTGDGDAAVKPSDIGELAGVSSSVKDTFAGAGSPSDIFSVLNDSGSFGFFSKEVADILEPSVPAAVSDEPFDRDALIASDPEFWEQFDIDDEGFCTPKFSLFDAESYLEGLE